MGGEINVFDYPDGTSNAFDVYAFDEAIAAHGVLFVHYRGMRSPLGLVDKYDSRRPGGEGQGASNGMLYTKAGCFHGLFTGNSKALRALEGGRLDAATAQLTPTRFYRPETPGAPCEPVYLQPMDRLYLAETSVLVTHQQLVEHHATGADRLKFPAEKVLDLVDSAGTRYGPEDFAVVEGQVVWKARRPPVDPDTGRGAVYAVRYLYRPFWYVDRLMHETRVVQQENPVTGERVTVRMPQSAVIQREYVFQNETEDPAPDPGPRRAPVPADGGFGPR